MDEIAEELRLLRLLQQNDIPVAYPVADKNGGDIQTVSAPEGLRFGVLFSFAQGEKLHLVSAETHHRIGTLMGRMHNITEQVSLRRTSYTPEVLLQHALPELERFLPADIAEMDFMRTAKARLLQVLTTADATQLRSGAVHLDIWFDNISVDGDKITVFDFDFCGNGWLALDVAYYIMQLHNVEKYEPKDYQPKADAFLSGYESVRMLTAEEKRLLPALGVSLYFFYLSIQCRRYENWSNAFLNDNYLKRFIAGLVKRYYDIYGLSGIE
jgi:Ser/Thr protein kinase RdoA (MazF antagonist)